MESDPDFWYAAITDGSNIEEGWTSRINTYKTRLILYVIHLERRSRTCGT